MNLFIPLLGASTAGDINFSSMATNTSGYATNGHAAAVWVCVAAIALGLVSVVAGRMNKSELLSNGGAGVMVFAMIAAFWAYGSGAAGAAMIP